MRKGCETYLFNKLLEISRKLDKSLLKIEEQSLIIYSINLEIKRLNIQIEEKDKRI